MLKNVKMEKSKNTDSTREISIDSLETMARLKLAEDSREDTLEEIACFLEFCSVLDEYEALPLDAVMPTDGMRADKCKKCDLGTDENSFSVPLTVDGGTE